MYFNDTRIGVEVNYGAENALTTPRECVLRTGKARKKDNAEDAELRGETEGSGTGGMSFTSKKKRRGRRKFEIVGFF
jgi:hypothetical protein